MTFSSLGLSEPLLHTLASLGHHTPTPVQQQAIPAILAGRDLLAAAQTGTGKTAGFALPLLQRLSADGARAANNTVRALVLVPTRELAEQVGERIRAYGAGLPLSVAAVYGGVSINPQMMKLRRGIDILVATPGRLLDLHEHNALKLSTVTTLVLDEADRLLDLGFADELGRLFALLPRQRQTLFFSATFPPAVTALAETLLREPARVALPDEPHADSTILQRAIEVDAPRRTQLLVQLIRQHGWEQVLVFVASRQATENLAAKLDKAGIAATALHGDLSQGARTRALADFKTRRLQVLVATDVAARGIDIEQLPAVVNFDLPRSPADYTHRIGRTGRAGASGVAISFVSAASEAHFRLIEKRQRLRVTRERIAGFEPVETAPAPADPTTDAPPPNGGIKGKRMSKKDKLRAAAAKSGE
ncbi:DEAD/DEAH box helicase [Neisseriaceae bacterium JH1-16]|nr:DEAD/DEAH box helicase [Neisseriaceae bacterium JH1-16]